LTILALGRQTPSKKTMPTLENIARVRVRAQQDIPTLVKRGLPTENDSTYALFSPNFARWLSREITAPVLIV